MPVYLAGGGGVGWLVEQEPCPAPLRETGPGWTPGRKPPCLPQSRLPAQHLPPLSELLNFSSRWPQFSGSVWTFAVDCLLTELSRLCKLCVILHFLPTLLASWVTSAPALPSPSSTHPKCPQPGDRLCNLQEHGRSDRPSRSGAGMLAWVKASNHSSYVWKFWMNNFSSSS